MSEPSPGPSNASGQTLSRQWLETLLAWLAKLRAGLAWGTVGEVGLIVLWALFVGRGFFNLDPAIWPAGGEFGWAVNAQYIWNLLRQCGNCVLWNGYINGGSPAFAELHGTVLHPIVVVTTVLWGAINSAKLTVVASLITAGLVQWWLARLLKLGRLSRLWSAALAVVGGHLAGRMQAGIYPLMLSTAFGSLVIPAGLQLMQTRRPRAVAGLGAAVALLLLSGQAYLQLGVALAILPSFLVFLLQRGKQNRAMWRQFALGLALGLLLAAVFLLPLARFWPHFAKHRVPTFERTQTPGNALLNLVISDDEFYRSDTLAKFPYPFIYVNYIGWVPVILAIAALRLIPRSRGRTLAFFVLAIVLVYLASSAVPLRLLARVIPDLATAVRHPDLIAGLAVPLVLALAAWGLDEVLQLDWPRLTVSGSSSGGSTVSLRIASQWLVLALPLLWSLASAYDFGKYWMGTRSRVAVEYQIVEELVTPDSQWVAPPFGKDYWLPLALDRGLKITNVNRPWFWKDRTPPAAALEATQDAVDLSGPGYLMSIDDVHFFEHPENAYACVYSGGLCIPCRATALGGNIDVQCDASVDGTLTVYENSYAGWRASRDGAAVPLRESEWLSVEAPAGQHTYQFRYRPWDATLGILLTLCGVVVAAWWWWRPPWWLEATAPEDEGEHQVGVG